MPALLAISLTTMLYMLSIGIIIPILPFLILDKGGGTQNAALAFSIFSSAAFISAPIWGRMSDAFGRKPILLASALITAISYLWLLNAENVTVIFASRIMAGIGAGWFPVSRAFVSDITEEKDRSKGMGFVGASIGIGFTIGPALGGWAISTSSQPNYSLAFILCASIVILNAVLSFLILKEPARGHFSSEKWRLFPVFNILRKKPDIRLLFIFCFLILLAFEGCGAIFAPWFRDVLQLGPAYLAWVLSFSGAISIFAQASIHMLVKKWKEKQLLVSSMIMVALSMLLMSFNKSFIGVFPAIALLAIGISLYTTLTQSLISKKSEPQWQGSILGGFQSLSSLARILGPIWASFAFVAGGPALPFIVGVTICLITLILFKYLQPVK